MKKALPFLYLTLCTLFVSAQDIKSYVDTEIPIDFVDMNGGLPTEILALAGEDEVYPVTIPFNFQFFNNTYTSLFASINGNVSFSSNYSGRDFNREHLCYPVAELYDPAREQDAANPDNFIPVYWADLFLESTCMPSDGGQPKLAYRTVGTAPNRTLLITWDYMVLSGDLLPCANQSATYGGYVKAQLKLFETSNNIEIHILYNRLSAQEATIGVENEDATYANYVKCGANQDQFEQMAWRFTPSEDEDPGNQPPGETSGYCTATGDFCGDTYGTIGEFTFGTVTTSGRGCEGGLDPTDKAYADNTDVLLEYEIGTPVDFSGTITDDLLYTDQVALWIDWNQDTIFAEDELVLGIVELDQFSGTVNDPLGEFKPGITRLRIRTYSPANCSETPNPCGETCGNEVEDYHILITDPAQPLPECPQAFLPADNARNVCPDTELAWNSPANLEADSFRLRVFDAGSLIYDFYTTDTFFNPSNDFAANTNITWIVDALADELSSSTCDTSEFSTSPNGMPVIAIIPSGDQISVCETGSLPLDLNIVGGSAPFTFSWSGPASANLDDKTIQNPVYTPVAATSEDLLIQLVDDYGCFSNVDFTTINVAQSVDAGSISPAAPEICIGEDFNFNLSNSDGGINFQISFNGGTDWLDTIPESVGQGFRFAAPTSEFLLRSIADGGICKDTSDVVSLKINPLPAQPTFSHPLNRSFCVGDSTILEVSNYTSDLVWSDASYTAASTLTVKVKGDFTVTYTDPTTGCASTSQTVVVTTNPKPAFRAVQAINNDPACEGIPVRLFVNSPDKVTWVGPEVGNTDTLDVFADGDYYAIMTNQFFCTTNSNTITLTFGETPVKPVISQSNDTLYASTVADSYKWFKDGSLVSGASNNFLKVTANAVYTVIAVADGGCESPLSNDYSFVVGINELKDLGISVYPNPSKDFVNLSSQKVLSKISLIDVVGNTVSEYNNTSKARIALPTSGVYFVKITLEGGKEVVTKIISQQ